MTSKRDYYAVLGVAPGSEDVVITAAYRALMRRYHPDTNKDSTAQQRAREINEAYAVLGDATKRAEYDRSRPKAQAGSAQEKPKTAPGAGASTNSKPGAADARSAQSSPNLPGAKNSGFGWFAAIVIIGIIALPSLLSRGGSSNAVENTLNVDETLTTENVVANDTTAIDASIAMDTSLTTDNVIAEVAPLKLNQQEAGGVEYANVERAGDKFADILMKDGLAGARAYSVRCHKGVVEKPSWSAADFCAAFDFAAAHIDLAISKSGNFAPNGYFQFQRENQNQAYVEAGAYPYTLSSRLSTIRRAVEPAVVEAMDVHLARRRAAREREKSMARPPADPFAEEGSSIQNQ